MAKTNSVVLEIKVDDKGTPVVKGFKGELKQLGNTAKTETGKADKGFGSMWKQMLGGQVAFAAVQAGFRMVTQAVGDSVKLFIEQERVEKQLESVLKSTGGVAGLTATQLKGMATELQGMTTYGDEAIIGAENLLLTFKNIGGETFPRALESILDVSTAMGQDLKSSSIQLGKALNDPVKGLSAMSRVGITFTKVQETMIKDLATHNDLAGAQAIILTELESQFGGSAKAAAASYGGQLTQLNNTWGDVQEAVGGAILKSDGFQAAVEGIKDLITSSEFKNGIVNAVNAVVTAFGFLADAVGVVWEVTKFFGRALLAVVPGLRETIKLVSEYATLIKDADFSFADALVGNEQGLDNLATAQDTAIAQTRTLTSNFFEFTKSLEKGSPAQIELKKQFGLAADKGQFLSRVFIDIKGGKFDKHQADLSEQAKIFTDKMKGVAEKTKTAAGEIKKATPEVDANKKAITEATTEMNNYMKSLGIIPVKDLKKETNLLTSAYINLKPKLIGNETLTNNIIKKTDELINKYKESGRQVPSALTNINDKLKDMHKIIDLPKSERMAENIQEMGGMAKLAAPELNVLNDVNADGTIKINTYADATKKAKEEMIKLEPLPIRISTGLDTLAGAFADLGAMGIADMLDRVNQGFQGIQTGITGIGQIASGDLLGGFSSLASGIGSVVSSISGLFASDGVGEAVERRLQGLTVGTGDWSEKLETLADTLTGTGTANRAFNLSLGEMISSSSVTSANLDQWSVKAREIFVTLEDGSATVQETATAYGSAFQAMVQASQNLGMEGGEAMRSMILLANEKGLKIREITEYVNANMTEAFKGYGAYIQSGFSEATLPVFEEMIRLEEVIADNSKMVQGMEGLGQAMGGLGNAVELTAGRYDFFVDRADEALLLLQAQGLTSEEQIAVMAPLLEQLAFHQSEFGLQVSGSTQELINQGIATGQLQVDTKTETALMADAFGGFTNEIRNLVDVIKNELPGAIRGAAGAYQSDTESMMNQNERLNRSVDGVRDNIIKIGRDARRADEEYQDAMEGHSMITTTNRFSSALVVAQNNILEIGKKARIADAEYSESVENMNSLQVMPNVTPLPGGESGGQMGRQEKRLRNRIKNATDPHISERLQKKLRDLIGNNGPVDSVMPQPGIGELVPEFQRGGYFKVPSNIDAMPIVVHKNERVKVWRPDEVTPLPEMSGGKKNGDTYIFQITIEGDTSMTADQLKEQFDRIFDDDHRGFKTSLKRKISA